MATKLFLVVSFLLIALGFSSHARCSRNEQTKADAVVVYSASWCAPCRHLKPVLTKLKSLGYKVCVRDFDKIKPGEFRPNRIPAVYLFRGTKLLQNRGLNSNSSLQDFRSKMIRP